MKKENGATLSPEESSNFFRLFLPLLQAVNYNYEICDTLEEQFRAGRPSMKDLKEVANALWEDTGILDEYITAVSEQRGLSEEDRLVLESWKHPVSATFVLERHLSKGSIFIDPETGKVYLVKGLTQTWSEIFPWAKPPIVLEATLIPFCGCIISDGLVAPLRVSLGPGYRESFKQLYLEAKQSGEIITSLDKEP